MLTNHTPHSPRSPSRHSQRGSGMLLLIEVMLGSIILASAYGSYYTHTSIKDRDAKLERSAATDRLIADAANSYIAENYEILTNQITAGRICDAIHRATDPWPAWKQQVKHIGSAYIDDGDVGETAPCSILRPTVFNPDYSSLAPGGLCSDNQCVAITINDLKATNALPSGAADHDEFGSEYSIVIRRSGTAPYYNLNALVATKAPVYRNTSVYQDAMGHIIGFVGDSWYRAGFIGRSSGVVRIITADDIARRPELAGAGIGSLAVFGIATKGVDNAGNPINTLGWSEAESDGTIWRMWPNITTEGQVVTMVGYKASQWSSYLRRDGVLPMTGDLNMDKHNVRNAGFVQTVLEAPFDSVCNQPTTGTTSAEKAPVGAMARVATGSNAIGEGLLLVCQMDTVGGGMFASTYKWKKLTSGVDTADDLKTGLNAGYETTEMPACLSDGNGNWIMGGAAPWPAPQSQKWTKWVYGKTHVGLYVNTFVDPMSGTPGPGQWMRAWSKPYTSGTDNEHPTVSFYSVASEVNRNAFCTSSLQDPGRLVATGAGQAWVGIQDTDRSVLMITPKVIQYFVKGVFGRTAADPSINANMGKVVSFVGHVDVPTTTCTTDAFGVTTCSSVTTSYPVTHDPNDSNVITKENWVASQIGQTINWAVTRRTNGCVDGAGALQPNC